MWHICLLAFHAVMFHPSEPRLILSANSKEGIALWDIRKPKTYVYTCFSFQFSLQQCLLTFTCFSYILTCEWFIKFCRTLLRYGGLNADQCCMSARFSTDGSKILALRRRLPPILYDTYSTCKFVRKYLNTFYILYHSRKTRRPCVFWDSILLP